MYTYCSLCIKPTFNGNCCLICEKKNLNKLKEYLNNILKCQKN